MDFAAFKKNNLLAEGILSNSAAFCAIHFSDPWYCVRTATLPADIMKKEIWHKTDFSNVVSDFL